MTQVAEAVKVIQDLTDMMSDMKMQIQGHKKRHVEFGEDFKESSLRLEITKGQQFDLQKRNQEYLTLKTRMAQPLNSVKTIKDRLDSLTAQLKSLNSEMREMQEEHQKKMSKVKQETEDVLKNKDVRIAETTNMMREDMQLHLSEEQTQRSVREAKVHELQRLLDQGNEIKYRRVEAAKSLKEETFFKLKNINRKKLEAAQEKLHGMTKKFELEINVLKTSKAKKIQESKAELQSLRNERECLEGAVDMIEGHHLNYNDYESTARAVGEAVGGGDTGQYLTRNSSDSQRTMVKRHGVFESPRPDPADMDSPGEAVSRDSSSRPAKRGRYGPGNRAVLGHKRQLQSRSRNSGIQDFDGEDDERRDFERPKVTTVVQQRLENDSYFEFMRKMLGKK